MLNFNVIVVTTDLSDYSKRALPYAIGLAERFKAKLKVLYVNEPSLPVSDVAWVSVDTNGSDEQRLKDAKTALDVVVKEQMPRGIDVETCVMNGNAVDTVVGYARDVNADLIVLCTHGRTGLSHALMGSTAEAIVRRAPCPVLTLKQPMPVAAAQRGA